MALRARAGRLRLLTIVIVLGVGLVLSLSYILTSQTNQFVEDDSLQQQLKVRFSEPGESKVHVVGRENNGVFRVQDGGIRGQIPMAVDIDVIESHNRGGQGRLSPNEVKTYTSAQNGE